MSGWTPQTPACDRCTQGVMDATNDHLWGVCKCECHSAGHQHHGPTALRRWPPKKETWQWHPEDEA